MTDKNSLQKQKKKVITSLENDVEGLKISMTKNRANLASVDSAIIKLSESNEEL